MWLTNSMYFHIYFVYFCIPLGSVHVLHLLVWISFINLWGNNAVCLLSVGFGGNNQVDAVLLCISIILQNTCIATWNMTLYLPDFFEIPIIFVSIYAALDVVCYAIRGLLNIYLWLFDSHVIQVNIRKTKKTYCKNNECWKHTLHKVTQCKKGDDSLSAQGDFANFLNLCTPWQAHYSSFSL